MSEQVTEQAFRKIMGSLGKFAGHPATRIAVEGFQQGSRISKELLGYDFFSLISKLVIFYTIAYAFAKLMEGIIHGKNFLNSFILGAAKLFGVSVPAKESLPPQLVELFQSGIGGTKLVYWDLIKMLSLGLILLEWLQYYNANKNAGAQPSAFTMGVFGILASAIAIITLPEIYHKLSGKPLLRIQPDSAPVGSNTVSEVLGDYWNEGPAVYGWKHKSSGNVIFEENFNILPQGSFQFTSTLKDTTDLGTYVVYVRQEKSGEKPEMYAEVEFKVVQEIFSF